MRRVMFFNSTSIRLLALDVDGTLLTSDHRISAGTRAAVQAAVNAGLQVVLASARSPRALRPLLAELGISGYTVAYAGGLVCRLNADASSDVIYEQRLSLNSAQAIVRYASEQGISVGWFAGETWHIAAWDDVLRREAAIIDMPPHITPLLAMLTDAPHKLQCMVANDGQTAKLARLLAELPSDCSGQFSHRTYLEVMPYGVDKTVGLHHLSNSLTISLQETAAIGDGENDLAMLQSVGLGIAMGNASLLVQRAAAWVTASNDDDGVARAIERILSMNS